MKEVTNYYVACNAILNKFIKKQDLDFDGWIGDEIGGIASFCCQYFFNMDDMVRDLGTKQKKGFILDWQNDGTDFNMNLNFPTWINYKSYIMGARYKDLKDNS